MKEGQEGECMEGGRSKGVKDKGRRKE